MIKFNNRLYELKFSCVILILFLANCIGIAQEVDSNPLLNLSLEELMHVKIISATKSEESSFNSPLTSFVITAEEIMLSGSTSIPEALRLCPGLIIRQTANGSYDVSIRGGVDGFTAYSTNYTNTTILTMIDNQPVFNYLEGGTFWQNLPIGLADIQKVEIVYGPMSALYGPNAVSGVINIITKNSGGDKKTNTNTSLYQGIHSQLISVRSYYKVNNKLQLGASLHHEKHQRFDDKIYSITKQEHISFDSIPSQLFQTNRQVNYPNEDQSLYRQSAIASINYSPNEDISINLKGAINNNIGLYPFITSVALSNFSNNSKNIDLNATLKDVAIQFSYLNGKQGISGNNPAYFYLYENIHSYLDYKLSFLSEKIIIRPAMSFQSAYANDKMFSVDFNRFGVFNNKGRINNLAASLTGDIAPFEKLRLIVSSRADKFNYPDKTVISYLLVGKYQFNQKHNIRIISSRSYNSSFLQPTFLDFRLNTSTGTFISSGNKNLDLLENILYEIGYRRKLNKNTNVDVSFFRQSFSNFNKLFRDSTIINLTTSNTTFYNNYSNSNSNILQNGVTIALDNVFLNGKIRFRPNITIQNTEVINDINNTDKSRDFHSIGTPKVFSGCNLLIRPHEKWYIDLSTYYLDSYTYFVRGYKIRSKFSSNVNITYKVDEKIRLFLNCRNISNHTEMEGLGSDIIKPTVLVGLNMNY